MDIDSGISTGASEHVDRLLLREELNSIVMEAAAAGDTLSVGPHAKRLSKSELAGGRSQRSIEDELILIASQAGVAIEMGRD